MPKKTKSRSNTQSKKKSDFKSMNDQIEDIKKQGKKGKIAKAFVQLFSNIGKGTVKNAKNLVNTVAQIPDMDIIEFGKNFITGAKDYVGSNVQSVKDIVGVIKAFNHPEWYTKYQLPSTNLNFGVSNFDPYRPNDIYITGVRVPAILSIPGQLTHSSHSEGDNVILDEYLNPKAWRDSIQLLYAKLGGSNASNFPFTLEDLEGYILNVRGLVARLVYLMQCVAATNAFEVENGNSPMPALYALGASVTKKNVSDVLESRAYCIDTLNYIANQIAELMPMIPSLSIFERTTWLFGNTFLDDPDTYKATEINFIPTGYYGLKYEGQPGSSGRGRSMYRFIWKAWDVNDNKLDDLINELSSEVSAILSYSETSQISSYILKAYGDKAWMGFALISPASKPNFVHDPQLLKQFTNATTFGGNGQNESVIYNYSWNDPTMRFDGAPNYEFTVGDNVVESTTIGGALQMVITSENPDISMGEVLSLTAMNGGYRPLVLANTKTLRFVGTERTTEILYRPECIYSTSSGGYDTYYTTPRSQIMGEWYYTAFDALFASQVQGVPAVHTLYGLVEATEADIWIQHNGDGESTWCNYLNELDIYAYASVNNIHSFNRTRTLSMMQTIDIQDQNNYKSVK